MGKITFKEWTEAIYKEWPQKGKARREFELNGKIPEDAEVNENMEMTQTDYERILAALAASDNHIRKENQKFFNEQKKSNHGEHIPFKGNVLHNEKSLTIQDKKDAALWDEIKGANAAIVAQKAAATPTPSAIPTPPRVNKTFMGEVQRLKDEGMPTDKAMMATAKKYPELHTAYLKEAN